MRQAQSTEASPQTAVQNELVTEPIYTNVTVVSEQIYANVTVVPEHVVANLSQNFQGGSLDKQRHRHGRMGNPTRMEQRHNQMRESPSKHAARVGRSSI